MSTQDDTESDESDKTSKERASSTGGNAEKVTKIVLLGQTGAGKSSLGNCLLDDNSFGVSQGTDSCTDETVGKTKGDIRVIDCPGLDDSDGRDTEHIENIVEFLKKEKYINTFVLVRNGTNKRMSKSFKSMLTVFELMFGKVFWNHVLIDVSHIRYDDPNPPRPNEWKRAIEKEFYKARGTELHTVFLDASDRNHPDFGSNVQNLLSYRREMKDFECKDFETTMTEIDELKQEKIKQANIIKERELDLEKTKESAEEDRKKLLVERTQKEELQVKVNQKEKEMDQLLKENEEALRKGNEMIKKLEKEKLMIQEQAKVFIEEEKWKHEKSQEKLKEEHNNILHEEKVRSEKLREDAIKFDKVIEKVDFVGKNVTEKFEVLEDRIDQQGQNIGDGLLNQEKKVIEIVSNNMGFLNDRLDQHAQDIENRLDIQEEKIDHTKKTYEAKISAMVEEGKKSDKKFEELYPALVERDDEKRAWKLVDKVKVGEKNNYHEYKLRNTESGSVKNGDGTKAARILSVRGDKNTKSTKTILLVGMTGSGKSTLIDALINYVYDIRYTDPIRLKLISLTSEEEKKQRNQATSQTDHITVYKIGWIPGMNIDFNVTLIDTPGLGDTRGIEYDKKMIKNIDCLFNSKEVGTLDSIGFVAKSGDVRLTAEQKYIFESVLQIFGKDIGENLVSLLTFYDNHALKILDAFKEAKIQFVQHFPYNSQAIFQKRANGKVDRHILTTNPGVSSFQDFYTNSKKFFLSVKSMSPKSLQLTQAVLKDREHIEATVEGLSIRTKELLLLKDRVDQEKRICEQHEADAKANENTEYEVTEDKVVKIDLEAGTFVTNCLECNRTCHYPCHIQDDEKKYNCAAMERVQGDDVANRSCAVCQQNCHWQLHRNMPFRLEIQSETVKKTYDDIKNRHKDFLDKAQGQVTIIEALEIESKDLSNAIQSNVDFITACLHRLSQNALRQSTTSSSDYLEQMIQAEDHERKPGFQRRIDQLRKEKAKADALANIVAGKPITSGINISSKKGKKPPIKRKPDVMFHGKPSTSGVQISAKVVEKTPNKRSIPDKMFNMLKKLNK